MGFLSTLGEMDTRLVEYAMNQTNLWTEARRYEAINDALQFITGSTKCLSSQYSTTLKTKSLLTSGDDEYWGVYRLPANHLELRGSNPVLVKTSDTGDHYNLKGYPAEESFTSPWINDTAADGENITGYCVFRDDAGFYLQLHPVWNGAADVESGLWVFEYVLHTILTGVDDEVEIRQPLRPAVPFLAASYIFASRREFKTSDFYEAKAMKILAPFMLDKDSTTDKETVQGMTRMDGEGWD